MANKMYLYAVSYTAETGQVTEWYGYYGEALHRAQETGGVSTRYLAEFTKAGVLRLLNNFAGGDSCEQHQYLTDSYKLDLVGEIQDLKAQNIRLAAENEELRGSKDQLALALETVERLTAERDEARGKANRAKGDLHALAHNVIDGASAEGIECLCDPTEDGECFACHAALTTAPSSPTARSKTMSKPTYPCLDIDMTGSTILLPEETVGEIIRSVHSRVLETELERRREVDKLRQQAEAMEAKAERIERGE